MSIRQEVFGPQPTRVPTKCEMIVHEETFADDLSDVELEEIHGASIVRSEDGYAQLNAYPVLAVSTLSIDQADDLLNAWEVDYQKLAEMKEVRVDIIYPLEKMVTLYVRPMYVSYPNGRDATRITVGLILWQVARVYREIYLKDYEDPDVFGIWGHDLTDLVYEAISIHEDGYCRISIGS